MDAYTTINDMWEISENTGYLLGNVYAGIGEIAGTGYCRQVTVDDIMRKSHKMITQINCTNQLHKTR